MPEEYKDVAAKLGKALWGEYKNPDDLERKLRLTLIEHALKRSGAVPLVQPLHRADSHLLQVLVHRFKVTNRGDGIHVQLEFDRKSPAIWRREARRAVREHLKPEQKLKCQNAIDDVVEGRIESQEFADPDFPFRHANGGVLPIIQIENAQYYCLFYRETDPIGWNIANGGSDDSDELIDPRLTIVREMREELIMVEAPPSNIRYTFVKGDKGAHTDLSI